MKKTTFILPVPSQPRFLKRINYFKNHNFNVNILSFERDYFKGNKEVLNYTSLGKIEHGKYVKRLKVYLLALFKLTRTNKSLGQSDLIYVFGIDILVIVLLFAKATNYKGKVYCEVGDLREVLLSDSIKGRVFRKLEKYLLNQCDKVIITSPYFFSDYYSKVQSMKESKFLVLENKLPGSSLNIACEKLWDGKRPLVIGLFGLLRCKHSWNLIKEISLRHPNKFQFYIRGYVMNLPNFEKEIKEMKNMNYEGEYVSPDDLASMYEKIDISWIGNIGNNELNGRMALPNRLYESLAFRTPMIAHKDSGVARRVLEYESGWVFDFYNVDEVIASLLKINTDDYLSKYENTFIEEDLVYEKNDYRELINEIWGD